MYFCTPDAALKEAFLALLSQGPGSQGHVYSTLG